MKFRCDFVTNSSSSSFIINKEYDTFEKVVGLFNKLAEIRNKVVRILKEAELKCGVDLNNVYSEEKCLEARKKMGVYDNKLKELLTGTGFFKETDLDNLIYDILAYWGYVDSYECSLIKQLDTAEIMDMLSNSVCKLDGTTEEESDTWNRDEIISWYMGEALEDSEYNYDKRVNEFDDVDFSKLVPEDYEGLYNKMKDKPVVECFANIYNRYVLYGEDGCGADLTFTALLKYFCIDYCGHMG